MDLCEEDDFLYVALGGDGIASVNIQDPYDLREYAFCDTDHAIDIEVVNGCAYVADGRGGTVIVDLANKGKGKEIASHPPTHRTRSIAVAGNYVFSGDDEDGITVFVSSWGGAGR